MKREAEFNRTTGGMRNTLARMRGMQEIIEKNPQLRLYRAPKSAIMFTLASWGKIGSNAPHGKTR